MTAWPDGGRLPAPPGTKPHLTPLYSCPPGNVYVQGAPLDLIRRLRTVSVVVSYAARGGRNLGFMVARERQS